MGSCKRCTRMREPMRTTLKKSGKSARLFQVVWEILEGCFYLSKSQPSFDTQRSFVLRIVLW